MREYVLSVGIAIIIGLALLVVIATCVDMANSKETTSLDDALERPVKVERYIDQETGVACYWIGRNPQYVSCLELGITRWNKVNTQGAWRIR